MLDKIEELSEKYDELTEKIAKQDKVTDYNAFQKLAKEHAELKKVVEKYDEYKQLEENIHEAKDILHESNDKELKEIAQLEIKDNLKLLENVENELKLLLVPQDPYNDKNIYLEIRAGTGGDEASLFVADLLRMYTRYAEIKRWKVEIIDVSETGVGGYKEIILFIKGRGVYSKLKYEGGGHRVQRIPDTESGGRIHTSACTVAVLTEVDDVDVEIDLKDIRVDVYRASGAGGQHVNTTDSAVRLTHLPTNIIVTCQDERSQIKNKEKAMKLLKARIFDFEAKKRQQSIDMNRKLQVGTGDRSSRIRTYNFPQNRITDHRINLTVHNLDKVLEGDIGYILEELAIFDQAEILKSVGLS